MKKKLFSVFCIGVIMVFLLGACASSEPFKLDNTVPISSLSSKTVFFEIGMTEWERAIFPLIDAGIYNIGLNAIAEEYNDLQNQRVALLNEQTMDYYKNLYHTEIVSDVYPFNGGKFKINYFYEPNDETRRFIRDTCAKHDAEYALTLIGQMQTTGVSAFGINAGNRLSFYMALFDKSGNTISKGMTETDISIIKSKDVDKFISLFDEINDSVDLMLGALGKY